MPTASCWRTHQSARRAIRVLHSRLNCAATPPTIPETQKVPHALWTVVSHQRKVIGKAKQFHDIFWNSTRMRELLIPSNYPQMPLLTHFFYFLQSLSANKLLEQPALSLTVLLNDARFDPNFPSSKLLHGHCLSCTAGLALDVVVHERHSRNAAL
jgi:hypothetical protein